MLYNTARLKVSDGGHFSSSLTPIIASVVFLTGPAGSLPVGVLSIDVIGARTHFRDPNLETAAIPTWSRCGAW